MEVELCKRSLTDYEQTLLGDEMTEYLGCHIGDHLVTIMRRVIRSLSCPNTLDWGQTRLVHR